MRQRQRVTLECTGGRTKQAFKAECDIRNIIKQYTRTGLFTHVSQKPSYYADMTSVPDFHEAMNLVAKAQQDFDVLPASLRKRFSNDPAEFLDFVHNPSNLDEMRSLGLLKPEVDLPKVSPLPPQEAV